LSRTLPLVGLVTCLCLIAGVATAQNFFGPIDALQEVPLNTSPATGLGCYSYDPGSGMLSYDISFSGLVGTETVAHFHGPAPPGINAGVQFPLPVGSPKIGSVGPLTASQLSDLENGLWYVNIHTTVYPGGEIRGQVLAGSCTVAVEPSTWGKVKALYVD
jgi:hypothetical protein